MSLLENKTILVVDDETRLVGFVRMNLELEGCRVVEASNGLEALDKVRSDIPDLVLLDVMMPEMDGFEALKLIRQVSTVPIIMLTVKDEEEDLIKGLELGADDYLTKPFSPRELLSRMKAVLRRVQMESHDPGSLIVVDDDLSIDFQRHEVIARGEQVNLRPTEYRLLYHLVNNAGWVMTHEMLLAKVWGLEYREDSHLLRVYITYLRQKIEPNPSSPKYILTERGVGYRFVDFRPAKRASPEVT